MAESPSQSDAQLVTHQASGQQSESDLASLVFEMSQQVQMGMETMLKMVNEVDQNAVGIKEEIEKSKDFAMEKKRGLEEEKEQFQKRYSITKKINRSHSILNNGPRKRDQEPVFHHTSNIHCQSRCFPNKKKKTERFKANAQNDRPEYEIIEMERRSISQNRKLHDNPRDKQET